MPNETEQSGDDTEALSQSLITEMRVQSQSDRELYAGLEQELRRIARAKMRSERQDHTLQPTALVNEAFLKLYRGKLPADFWDDSARALRLIAHAMEQILTDYAIAHRALKRGGLERKRVPVDEGQAKEFSPTEALGRIDAALSVKPDQSEEILGVQQAVRLLRQTSSRQAEVVQLFIYGGLPQEEIAAALSLSLETVKLDWRKAKAFLKVHLASRLG
jgi:RNA polymerase sigma-70 factor (ECF subfamily)